MASFKSAEEVEREHLEKLGPDLGPLYHRLYNGALFGLHSSPS